jgi:hypothetical protein
VSAQMTNPTNRTERLTFGSASLVKDSRSTLTTKSTTAMPFNERNENAVANFAASFPISLRPTRDERLPSNPISVGFGDRQAVAFGYQWGKSKQGIRGVKPFVAGVT